MSLKIVNSHQKGCSLCQNPRVSAIVDPLIFECGITFKELLMNLENRDICVEPDMLRDHYGHVFAVDEDEEDYSVTLKTDPNMSTIDIVKDSLKKILILEKNSILEGKTDTKEFISLLKEKRDTLTLIARLEGELVDTTTINIIPEWIKKVPVIDAEVIPEKKKITRKKDI